METSKPSTGETLFDLTLYVADTPANLLAPQASAKASKTQDTYGLGYETPLANYDPDTQSWKMYGDTYLWGDSPLLESLPISGMTQNGVLFQQPRWVPLTGVIGSSLWPTPTAVTRPMEGNVRIYRAKIEAGEMTEAEAEAILGKSVWAAQGAIPMMWPTPTTQDHIQRRSTQQTPGSMHSVGLGDAVRMWATPTARDGKGAANYKKQSRNDADLTNQARAEDGVTNGSLNPTWVEWLMGFPTGWTDLED